SGTKHIILDLIKFPSNMRNKVWGYLVDEGALLRYGVRNGLGTADTPNARDNTIYFAAMNLLDCAWVSGHVKSTDATTPSRSIHTCFALARVADDPCECFGKPKREMIEDLKKVLKTDEEPRWYYW
ncbi:hypothetical protein C0995_010008, partial [Termitomyces sp. Mi166